MQGTTFNHSSRTSRGPSYPGMYVLNISAALFIGMVIGYGVATTDVFDSIKMRFQSPVFSEASGETPEIASAAVISAITALGRIEPQGEVIRLSAPTSARGGPSRIQELLVAEGDWVQANQVIAVLDEHDSRLADLGFANTRLEHARARLDKVREGAQEGAIAAQEATIARLEDELGNAETEYRRNRSLYEEGAISASSLDTRSLAVETLQDQIREARATLDRIAEVRPVDVRLAELEVDIAFTEVQQAQAALDLTLVKSPRDSQILKVHSWPGELVGEAGVAEIGQTDQMYVVAEVYQTDIRDVREGQSAVITGDAFDGELTGTITEVGWQIDRQDIFSVSPNLDTDRKIVEVRIRIDDPEESTKIASFTNLQVEVAIDV